ncbi:PepSY-associated TM helix domain-containing protein [Pseudothauera rhizosphaerae]|uniref:PepSY domain-containing protein n=1 Tax=Pseudothauera rhizosphaerae TaxID=2565932 RepID=A0A4V3W9I4_9RHOO|nr:PepSY-associated TM helix domain-containing protein [Pseudothauera rhizosphaerae]THF55399.1 PepSY domain-containing protein [Pseudothauera rhizosphaerae]
MNASSPTKQSTPRKVPGLRQTMSDLHIWTGLLVGWILYAMFLTGTVSYFRDEISQWMRPELAARSPVPDAAEVAQRVAGTLASLAPASPQWNIGLPDERNNVVSVSWQNPKIPGRRGLETAVLDPASGERLNARETRGGDFFYVFHFQFHYMPVPWGRWLAGFCAMFMLVAIVSGVIVHKKIFADFFTFRWGKGQRAWLDAHNALSVLGLPFHLMITYSGLITLMLLYMPWGSDAAFKTPAERQALTAEMNVRTPPGKPSGEQAELAPVADMVRVAQERWGRDNVGRVAIGNLGDAGARVMVVRGDGGRISVSPQYLMFDGKSGELLQVKDRVGPAAETRGVVFALHLGRFADTTVRWLYFLVSLAGTAMVGTGLVLWTVKRRAKLPDPEHPYFSFRLVERLNIATIAGLPLAMAAFLWGNRLLPASLTGRADWEIHLFFIAWGLTLAFASLRPPRRAWIELLWATAAALALLPLLNMLTTARGLPASLAAGDWVFAGFDLAIWAFAALAAILARRTALHKPRAVRQRARPMAGEPA